MKQTWILFFFALVTSLVFFWQTLFKGLLPIPTDALVGLYHPYRDFFASTNPQGVSYKNFILTDPVLQQYPWKWLAINDWKETFRDVFKGQALIWQGRALSHLQDNPYNFSGTPLLANIQAGVFYPLNVIFFLGEFHWAWTLYIVVQPILACFFMVLFLRSLSLSRLSSLFGGLVWAFSSFNLVWLEWGNIGHAGLWLPLALLCVDKIAKKKEDIVIPCLTRNLYRFPLKAGMTKLFWHGVLQFSLISSLFAGHFQVTFYLLAAMALYIVLLKMPGLAGTRPGLNKFPMFLVHCFLFIVLTSFQWLPAFRFIQQSNRTTEQADVINRDGFFIRPRQLVQLIAPDFFGNPATQNYRGKWNYAEQIIYVGIFPLLLVLIAIFSGFQLKKARPFSALQKFAALLLLGGLVFAVDNPVARLPYVLKLPFLSSLQPTRLSYVISFSLSVFAAIGLERFRRFTQKDWKIIAVPTGIIAGIFAILIVTSSKFLYADRLVSQRNLVLPALLFATSLVGLVFAGFVRKRQMRIVLFTVYCLLFTVFDLFHFGWKFTPFSPIRYLYPMTPAIQFLQSHMKPEDRLMTLDRRILPPNANIMYRLESINGYDPIYSKEYALKITEMESGKIESKPANFGRIVVPMNYKSPTARELRVRYVLSLSDIDDAMLTKVFQEEETRVYQINSWNGM